MPTSIRGWRGALLLGATAGLLTAAVVAAQAVTVGGRPVDRPAALEISVLSARPDSITGGDALVRVDAPAGTRPAQLRLMLSGVDKTGELVPTATGLQGVVRGLVTGANRLVALGPTGLTAELEVVSHPITGPVFSGPQTSPFVCQTAQFRTATREPLGAPLDRDCSITARTGYVYRSAESETFNPLPTAAVTDPAQRPRDLAWITLPDGSVRPFIVRIETASIDRGISQVAMLDDPSAAVRRDGGVTVGDDGSWNHKLIYAFGGSCGGGSRQGTRTVGLLSPNLLAQGYALASNSLNAFEQNCDDVLAAEAFAMTREAFIEAHGLPTYTMGIGCSGGSAQAFGIADNYPGLLDGIVAGCSVADVGTDAAQVMFDARLLQRFARTHPGVLSAPELQAVSGFTSLARLGQLSRKARVLDPAAALDDAIPVLDRYDRELRPRGVRGTIYDQTRAVYGTTTSKGVTRARRPLGNVGVQYGLTALRKGTISVEQFLTLNAGIGGLDTDLRPTAGRTKANPVAVERAYRTGRVLNGRHLGAIPVIDYRSYRYDGGPAALDSGAQSVMLRERLVRANGDADNLVQYADADHGRFDLEHGVVPLAIRQMDRWIVSTQQLGVPGHRGVVLARPADLNDSCWTATERPIARTVGVDDQCAELYPNDLTPRIVAGGPVSSDVLSCTLKAPVAADYGRRFTAVQWSRLRAIFPAGVCDWTKPGQGRSTAAPWQQFGTSSASAVTRSVPAAASVSSD